jgi:dTDP-4-amino-4,6-dideoxygalactose transaminase
MDEIMAIARRHNLIVVEDAAQGVFARYKDRWLGAIGHLGCYSFHETKNFSCGEGGALVVNDPRFEKRAEILRDKGTNRSQFLRGQVDKYSWVDVGSSYAPSDMLAAFLLGQLENMERITSRRRAIYDRYAAALAPLAAENRIGVPFSPSHCATNHHMFYLLAADLEERTALIAHLREAGILAVFHYIPLHSSPFARSIGLPQRGLPVTDKVSSCLVRLPMYYDLADHEVDQIARCVMAFYDRRARDAAGRRSFGRIRQRVKA